MSFQDLRHLVMRPIPPEWGMMEINIRRNKSGFNKLAPKYTAFVINENEVACPIIIGKKRTGTQFSNYFVTLNLINPKPCRDGYIGKVRKQYGEYNIYDDGRHPTKKEQTRRMYGSVKFTYNKGNAY